MRVLGSRCKVSFGRQSGLKKANTERVNSRLVPRKQRRGHSGCSICSATSGPFGFVRDSHSRVATSHGRNPIFLSLQRTERQEWGILESKVARTWCYYLGNDSTSKTGRVVTGHRSSTTECRVSRYRQY